MSTPSTSIIAGPARITFCGQMLWSLDDVIVSTRVRAFEVATANRPPQRREDRVDAEIAFTPGGAWPPMCALLQALGALAIGQDVFGGETPQPVVIDSADGWTYTYATGALTSPPVVTFSAGRPLFGPAIITALGAQAAAPSTDALNDPDPAAIVRQPYTLSWGSDPAWSNLTSADGVTLAFQLSLTPRQNDAAGVIGLRLANLAATARARPLRIADAAVLAALDLQDAGRGRTLGGPGAPDLVIAGTGVYARLYAAGLDTANRQFGAALSRVGELHWTASVTVSLPDGPLRPPFYLGTSAPAVSSL